MPTVSDNFLGYALNARATSVTQGYTGSNRADAPAVNGWNAVKVDAFLRTSSDFAAQAYTDGNGNFRISIRPSQTVGDWTSTNTALTAGKWNAELTDAIRFYGELIIQVQQSDRSLRLDDIRAKIDGSGFSQGGALIEAASKFWGTKGMNIDGPGVNSQMGLAEVAALKAEYRARGLNDLQDNYTLQPGQFEARAYTSIGDTGKHITDAKYTVSGALGELQDARDAAAWIGGATDAATAGVWVNVEEMKQWHNLNRIMAAEGYANPDAAAAAQRLGATPVQSPTDLNTTRNSSSYITDTSANDHQVVINTGGTLSDAWVLQKNSATGFTNAQEFYAAVLACNPGITNVNNIPAGTTLMMPERMRDGSITYNYAGGTAINSNATTGEYHMIVPDGTGGKTIYSRLADGDAGYVVKETRINAAGETTLDYTGYQESLNSDIKSVNANWKTPRETGSSTWSDGVRTDAVTQEGGTDTTLTVTDTETGQTQTLTASGGTSPTSEQLAQTQTNALYTDMAGFITALRNKDKLNQALYGAKIIIDTQIKDGVSPSLEGMQTALGGLSATVGVVAGLHALQSDDTRTQISGAVGLLSSANQLAAYYNQANGATAAQGFLDKGQLGMLNTMGALISLANLKNLDTMLENGQVGSAAASVYAAWQAGSALATAAAAEGSFLASMGGAAAFNPAVALAMVVGAMVFDDIFGGGSSYTPPPPPPFGNAHFVSAVGGGLTIQYADTNDLGKGILQTKMTEILTELNKEVAAANQGNTDPDRALVLIASRIPKVYLQSWPSYTGNGETNYYYMLEQTHPQNGQKIYSGVARQDIAKFFSGSLVMPEAIAQQWQINHLKTKFGTDEANWQTEGQWATDHSAIEQAREQLSDALTAANKTLTTAKEQTLHLFGDTLQADATQQAAINAAQLKVDAAQKAFDHHCCRAGRPRGLCQRTPSGDAAVAQSHRHRLERRRRDQQNHAHLQRPRPTQHRPTGHGR
jgi:hypothetical protein